MTHWHQSVEELLRQGSFQQAIALLDHFIQKNQPAMFDYDYRAQAFLGINDYAAAAADYRQMIRRWSIFTTGYIGLGICLWCLKQPQEAITIWKAGLNQHELGGKRRKGGVEIPLLLWYAAVRNDDGSLRKEVHRLLRARTQWKLQGMPDVLIDYALNGDAISAFMLENQSEPPLSYIALAQRCWVLFYSGVHGFETGDREHFRKKMVSCTQLKGLFLPEFHIACWEVKENVATVGLD